MFLENLFALLNFRRLGGAGKLEASPQPNLQNECWAEQQLATAPGDFEVADHKSFRVICQW